MGVVGARGAGVALVAAACFLPLFRQEGVPSWDTVMAEDGQAFVGDANSLPPLDPLFDGYNGYSQLISRILAVPTRYLPVGWIAPYLAISATVAAGLLALFVFRAAGSHIRSTPLRLTLAAACVAHPVLLAETTAAVVNLLWVLLFAAFWAVVSGRDSAADVAARAAVVFLAVTSTPLAAVYLPLMAWVCWRRRRRAEMVVAGAFVAGTLGQALFVLFTKPVDRWAPSSAGDLVVLYPVRVLGATLVGTRPLPWLWTHLGVALVVLTIVAAAAVAAPGVRAAAASTQRVALAAAGLSVVLFAAPLHMRGTAMMRLTAGTYNDTQGGRYVVVPTLLLLSALAVLYDQAATKHRRVAAVTVTYVVLVLVAGFRDEVGRRSTGPSWAEGLRAARQQCADRDPETRPAAEVAIPTSPGYPWAVTLRCDRMLRLSSSARPAGEEGDGADNLEVEAREDA